MPLVHQVRERVVLRLLFEHHLSLRSTVDGLTRASTAKDVHRPSCSETSRRAVRGIRGNDGDRASSTTRAFAELSWAAQFGSRSVQRRPNSARVDQFWAACTDVGFGQARPDAAPSWPEGGKCSHLLPTSGGRRPRSPKVFILPGDEVYRAPIGVPLRRTAPCCARLAPCQR